MRAIVYICCDGKQRQLGEQAIRLAWSDAPIDRKQPISMGAESNWAIADIFTYRNSDLEDLEAISVVYIYRGNKPSRTDWEFLAFKDSYPMQSLEIQTSEVGSNFLGWTVHCDGERPQVGQYLVTYGIKRDGSSVRAIEPWFRSDVVSFFCDTTYLSDTTDIPFNKVHLSLHKIRVLSEAPKKALA